VLVGLVMIKDVVVTKLDIIETLGGDVMHAMKESSVGYVGFGEVYFSQVNKGAIKAWKRHKKMTLNLVVPVGEIRFVLFDDREVSNTQFQEIIISKSNYCRFTVPPMIWMGFQGLSDDRAMLLNIANIEHNLHEVDRKEIDEINYDWTIS
jgi:dTDP-4-dehydrorhamnose 3,5-epimerase